MSDKTHNVSNTTTDNPPLMNFTEQELVEELETYYHKFPEKQPGDFAVKDLIDLWGGSESSWRRKLISGDVPDGWKALQVKGSHGAITWVLRKLVIDKQITS